jgi:hypothetical protein
MEPLSVVNRSGYPIPLIREERRRCSRGARKARLHDEAAEQHRQGRKEKPPKNQKSRVWDAKGFFLGSLLRRRAVGALGLRRRSVGGIKGNMIGQDIKENSGINITIWSLELLFILIFM